MLIRYSYSSNSSYSLCSSSAEKGETLIIDRATSSLLLLRTSLSRPVRREIDGDSSAFYPARSLRQADPRLWYIWNRYAPTLFVCSLLRPFDAIFIILSFSADYLVVITKRKLVSTILNTAIYAATDFSVFPVDRATTVELLAHPDEAYLLGLLKAHLFSAPFYFTYGGYNVTNRLQQQKLNDERSFWETVGCVSLRQLSVAHTSTNSATIDSSGTVIFSLVSSTLPPPSRTSVSPFSIRVVRSLT